jgi:hypothetical protein
MRDFDHQDLDEWIDEILDGIIKEPVVPLWRRIKMWRRWRTVWRGVGIFWLFFASSFLLYRISHKLCIMLW